MHDGTTWPQVRCVFADCKAWTANSPEYMRSIGWRQAVGHDDVWVCPACVKRMFWQKQAATGPQDGGDHD